MIDFFERVAAVQREGHSFAVATVVARRPPVSAHLGDHAIVFADGRMEGFVGGACAQEIVRQQALAMLHPIAEEQATKHPKAPTSTPRWPRCRLGCSTARMK